jgi:hypothetical protein
MTLIQDALLQGWSQACADDVAALAPFETAQDGFIVKPSVGAQTVPLLWRLNFSASP